MQKADAILQAVQKMGEKRIPLTRVYRNLYSEELFLHAYSKLYRNEGALTPGTEDDTVDGMSLERIRIIIEQIRSERFYFRPSRRIQIPKQRGGTRPLGIPNFSEKLVQEVLRMLLEAYYEPRFRDSSHGFRPGRGCHTALISIKQRFRGATWFIEGDIRGCFDNISQEVLLKILARDIHDGRLLRLIGRCLKAGFVEKWRYHQTYSGTPQGGVLSPLLTNIYLNELDSFIEDTLTPRYTQGKVRAPNPEYERCRHQLAMARKHGDAEQVKRLVEIQRSLPSMNPHDPNFRRLKYIRYADDFILAFIGPKSEAEAIRQAIGEYLQQCLHLEMHPTKTLITHAKTDHANFLNYAISAQLNNEKLTESTRSNARRTARSVNGVVRLGIPHGLVTEKIKRYQRHGKPVHEPALTIFSDAHIIDAYQRRFQGLSEYYKYAVDRWRLSRLEFVMEIALVKTLAFKYKVRAPEIFRRYRSKLQVDARQQKLVATTVPTAKGQRVIYFGGESLRVVRTGKGIIQDTIPYERGLHSHSELLQRLNANACELCGKMGDCEVHHIRKLADINKPGRKPRPEWVKRMAAMRRKTLIVCTQCHKDIHAGRPTPKFRT